MNEKCNLILEGERVVRVWLVDYHSFFFISLLAILDVDKRVMRFVNLGEE